MKLVKVENNCQMEATAEYITLEAITSVEEAAKNGCTWALAQLEEWGIKFE